MRLGTNMTALTVSTQLSRTNRAIQTSSLRLSSAKRINVAKDDPAGMAIANRLSSKIGIGEVNSRNYSDGISLVQTVDSSLSAVGDMLQRMRELSVQSATDTVTNEDREKMQVEVAQLKEQIDKMSTQSAFNGIKFLNGDSTRLTYPSSTAMLNYSYVSGSVPEGQLKYDITSFGEPAEIAYTELAPETDTASESGTINLNSYVIDVEAGETYADINAKIKKACDATNVLYFNNKLVSKDEGSDETVSISATPSGFLGITDASATGKDAVIENVKLYALPDGTVEIPSFNNGLSVIVDGNSVKLNGTNNQVVEFDLNFKVDSTGNYVYGGSTTSPAPYKESSKILDSGQLKVQSGDTKSGTVDIYFRKINTQTIGIEYLNISTRLGADKALTQIDKALSAVLAYRAEIGAYQNRMETSSSALDDANVNMKTYLSTVQDTDVAYEMSTLANQNLKMQAAMSVLAQANQRPQQILQLLN